MQKTRQLNAALAVHTHIYTYIHTKLDYVYNLKLNNFLIKVIKTLQIFAMTEIILPYNDYKCLFIKILQLWHKSMKKISIFAINKIEECFHNNKVHCAT